MSKETQILQDCITSAQLAGDTKAAGQYRWRLNCQERLEAGAYKKSGSFLHVATVDRQEGKVGSIESLLADFAGAMLEKMQKNYLKREAAGLSSRWDGNDWQGDCVRQLQEHIAKGDPLDVAILSAFCWYHGWPVSGADTPAFSWLNLMPEPVTWHELKTDEEMMTALRLRAKTSELRKDDRGFAVGDGLVLRGWDGCGYTGNTLRFPITSVLRGTKYGLMPGFVMLGLGDEVRLLSDRIGNAAPRIVDREQGCPVFDEGCQHDALCGACPNATAELMPRTSAKLALIKCPDGCNSFPCQCPTAPQS